MNQLFEAALKKLFDVDNKPKILFIEADNELYEPAQHVRDWLTEHKVETNMLFDVEELSTRYLLERIHWADIIVFSTTFNQFARNLKESIEGEQMNQKVFVECFVSSPEIQYNPTDHELYALHSYDEDPDRWDLYKIGRETWWQNDIVFHHKYPLGKPS